MVTDKLQVLYESETNCHFNFLGGGFTWKLGDDMNGFVAEGEAKTMHQAVAELVAAALCKFPDSVFAHKNLAT